MAPSEPDYFRFFPYDDPYQNQREAMDRIHDALNQGRDVLFEGACGTGKTLAALAPALEYAHETDKTVVITTNVHQQMRQFIAEARAITRSEPIRTVVFRGKASMCHLEVGYEECQALRETTHDLVETEQDHEALERQQGLLLERLEQGDEEAAEARSAVMDELETLEAELDDLEAKNTCQHFYGNLTADPGFEAWLFDDVRTPDEVYEYAHGRSLCGYELLKDAMASATLVVCNYHHLLEPMIREQFFRWLDRDPDDVIAVFDEAHNVERAAREHATRTLSERSLDAALDELSEEADQRAEAAKNLIEAFRSALVETYEAAELDGVDDDWQDVTIENDDRRDDLTLRFLDRYSGRGIEADIDAALALGRELDEQYAAAYKRGETSVRRESGTLRSAAFIETYLEEGTAPGQYPVVAVRRDDRTGEPYGRAELYACLPEAVTRPLFEELHASVLMSATLRPFDVTADVLGFANQPRTMAYGLSFPEPHRRTFAVDVPPLFASRRDDPAVQELVTSVLDDAIGFTPGNVLAFFPSYAEAARYADRVESDVLLDEPATRAEPLRETFVEETEGALFTSLWGTLTEGVSFDGKDARTVVVVGVPYPYLDDRLDAVQAAYDDAFADRSTDAGWEYAVEIPTVRKTRQALGRALRAPDEIGVRVLVDRRYTNANLGEYSVRDTFPPEEQEELIDVDPSKLGYAMGNFFADHGEWGSGAPTPFDRQDPVRR